MKRMQTIALVKATLEKHGFKLRPPRGAAIKGVDYYAVPPEGGRFELQVRANFSFYQPSGKEDRPQLRIAYPDRGGEGAVCIYIQKEALDAAMKTGKVTHTASWRRTGRHAYTATPAWAYQLPSFRRFPHADAPAWVSAPEDADQEASDGRFHPVPYARLNARQRQSRDFHKIAAAMADYGFNAVRLGEQWEGADFLADHVSGQETLRVRLKERFGFEKKCWGKKLWAAFRDANTGDIYVYPHDRLLWHYRTRIEATAAWKRGDGTFHFPHRSDIDERLLAPYRLAAKE